MAEPISTVMPIFQAWAVENGFFDDQEEGLVEAFGEDHPEVPEDQLRALTAFLAKGR